MRRRGFTLVELLLAMALMVAFGGLLLRFVGGALEVWRRAEGARELGEKATALFEILGRDLRAVHPLRLHESPRPNRARFQSELATLDRDGDKAPDTAVRRLRFVRALEPAEEWRALAEAAARAGGKAPSPQALAEAAGDGLAEVAWATVPDATQGDLSYLSLFRGARSLALDPRGSFFRDGFFAAPGTFGGDLREVAAGVLEFAVLFPLRGARDAEPIDPDRPSAAASACWDSTRGLALDLRLHPGNRFPLERGEASFADPRDDVFPSRAVVTLVLGRSGPGRREPRLANAVGPTERLLEVDDVRSLPRAFPFLAKVEGEWVEVTGVSGKALTLGRRAARETPPAAHPAGAAIHVGETFRAEFPIEAGREDWNG